MKTQTQDFDPETLFIERQNTGCAAVSVERLPKHPEAQVVVLDERLAKVQPGLRVVVDFSQVERVDPRLPSRLLTLRRRVGPGLILSGLTTALRVFLIREGCGVLPECASLAIAQQRLVGAAQWQLRLDSLIQGFRNAKRAVIQALIFHSAVAFGWHFFRFAGRGQVVNEAALASLLDEGFVLAANHVSYLDWIILWSYCYKRFGIKLTFLAKEKLFVSDLWAGVMAKAGCIMVANDGSHIIDALGAQQALSARYLAIFPEGTRSNDGRLQAARPGAIKFARKMGRPLIPVGLRGFFEAWKPEQKLPKPYPLAIHVGEPLRLQSDCDAQELDRLMREIAQLTGEGA